MARSPSRSAKKIEQESAFESRKTELLVRVASIFANEGYHETSVNLLATRLNVSKPVLYYYAKNKDDLLFQCGEIARDALSEVINATASLKISTIEKMRHFFCAYAEIMCSDFGRCLTLMDSPALSAAFRKKAATTRRGLEENVRQIITQGQSDGSIRTCDPVTTTRAMFGAFGTISRWYPGNVETKPRDVASAYIDLFVAGIGR